MIELSSLPVRFFSQLDEVHLFDWAKQIDCISRIDQGCFHIDPEKVDDTGLRDLLALCARYRISAQPLASLVTASNVEWFKNLTRYWYGDVFGENESYRLYSGSTKTEYSTFTGLMEAADELISDELDLRIEILGSEYAQSADFWAYEYESSQWVPS